MSAQITRPSPPPLQPPPSCQAFCACFAWRQKRNIIREREEILREKNRRGEGKKKKKNSIYPVSDRGEITANKSDNDPGVV